MKKILKDTFTEIKISIVKFFKNNINFICNLIQFILPFLMFAVGKYIGNKFYLIIALIILIIIFFIKSVYKQIVIKDRLSDFPIPSKRFTKETDGEVNMEESRLEELLLYVCDVEDWIEQKGLKK